MLSCKKRYVSLWTLLAMALVGPASASTLTADIGISLTIGDGCTISNGSTSGSTNQWGTLNFGTYSDLTNVIDGSVADSAGSNAVTILCTSGLSPTLSLDSGLHGDGTLRNVAATITDASTGTSSEVSIPYRLYSDSDRSTEIALNTPFSFTPDGTAQNLPVYGRILPSDQGDDTAPAAGTYTDTVVATLTW